LWDHKIVLPGQSVNDRKVVLCSPAIFAGKAYLGFDGARMFAWDLRRGKQLWTFDARDAIRSSPTVSAEDGILYFGCNDGCLYALDADSGELKWKFTTGGKIHSTPWAADGVVYVGSDDGYLYALEGK